MSILVPHDTAQTIGPQAGLCESRALFASRFADPTSKEDARKMWFNHFIAKKAAATSSRQADAPSWHPPGAVLLHARLQSRLMVNMAGGVMENAGLSLDRYGLPHIPGSAVKGCARRAALAALREWCETETKPAGDENLFTPLCAGFASPADLLKFLCLVFGWVEQDWSTEKNTNGTWKSDFAWACHGIGETWKATAETLCGHFHAGIKTGVAPWESLPNSAGSIAFLHASPNRDPGLVLDVLTPHHKDYYEGKLQTATDTEDPVPVFFPAVREQGEKDYFTFPLIPLPSADSTLLEFAKLALRTGLETFGLGAKTNAGYGWFDASEALNEFVHAEKLETANRQAKEAEADEKRKLLEEETKIKAEARASKDSILAGLSPEAQEDKKLEWLTDAQFDAKVRAFCKEPRRGGPTEVEKKAIVRALREPRLAYWQTFKTKATKGDPATVDQAIRALSKTLNLGKMP